MVRPHVSRRDFAAPLNALQTELNRLIENYWPPWAPGAPGERPASDWSPSVDVYETAESVIVVVDVPGVEPATIDLSVDGQILTLRGERPGPAAEAATSGTIVRERPCGSFHRQVTLPSPVDIDKVQADARHGVLHVKLPKTESARTRHIPIQPT